MTFLLYAAILGFALWIISELMELVVGYVRAGYYLTSVFHFLAGAGIWGLYLLPKSMERSTLSLVGAAMISIAYFSIVYLPIDVLNSGLVDPAKYLHSASLSGYFKHHQLYEIGLCVFVIGHILFGIAVIRADYFPDWTGVMLIVTVVFITAIYVYEIISGSVPANLQKVLNIVDIGLAATVIYMCVFGLNKMA